MSEELLYSISTYRRRFPKPIGNYTLLFTSHRIIVAKTLPSWIELSPLYLKGASYFLLKKSLEQRQETFKTMPFDEILEDDKENFEIPYSNVKEVKLFGKKLSIKFNETEHTYNLIAKKPELTENLNPILHSVLAEKFVNSLS
jgi:hypothetical protein